MAPKSSCILKHYAVHKNPFNMLIKYSSGWFIYFHHPYTPENQKSKHNAFELTTCSHSTLQNLNYATATLSNTCFQPSCIKLTDSGNQDCPWLEPNLALSHDFATFRRQISGAVPLKLKLTPTGHCVVIYNYNHSLQGFTPTPLLRVSIFLILKIIFFSFLYQLMEWLEGIYLQENVLQDISTVSNCFCRHCSPTHLCLISIHVVCQVCIRETEQQEKCHVAVEHCKYRSKNPVCMHAFPYPLMKILLKSSLIAKTINHLPHIFISLKKNYASKNSS